MPEPFLIGIAVALGLGVVAAAVLVIFWGQIIMWAYDSIFPWIQKNIPSIESEVREAFTAADNVVSPMRNLIRQAWKKLRQYLLKDKKLRQYLLKQVIELERKSSGGWIKQITYSAIKIIELNITIFYMTNGT
ncbi:MAG: hypothetical protein F6K18_27145 [Okeania sp. SIO2C2]|uniref:hypothetical protein n=1 Tax=Okeania sp. SIO2C2 TaxID=2607787 RepID=UPI0013B78DF1|nr:hypothetical protein [Okeania sp. SIO2C2]NEP90205.1 hypothetical protein [Okeania sp. SIO2C2]